MFLTCSICHKVYTKAAIAVFIAHARANAARLPRIAPAVVKQVKRLTSPGGHPRLSRAGVRTAASWEHAFISACGAGAQELGLAHVCYSLFIEQGAMSAAEYLAHALPPQGSTDLPYKPEQRWTVRQHILDLIEVCHACHMEQRPLPLPLEAFCSPAATSTPAPPAGFSILAVLVTMDWMQEFPTLMPRKQLYTHHDGRHALALVTWPVQACWLSIQQHQHSTDINTVPRRAVQLLLVAGTLPMYYQVCAVTCLFPASPTGSHHTAPLWLLHLGRGAVAASCARHQRLRR